MTEFWTKASIEQAIRDAERDAHFRREREVAQARAWSEWLDAQPEAVKQDEWLMSTLNIARMVPIHPDLYRRIRKRITELGGSL